TEASLRLTGKGGGILLFLKHHLNYEIIDKNLKSVESILLKVNVEHKTLYVLCMYKQHQIRDNEFLSLLEQILQKLDSKDDIILIGDININLLNQTTTSS